MLEFQEAAATGGAAEGAEGAEGTAEGAEGPEGTIDVAVFLKKDNIDIISPPNTTIAKTPMKKYKYILCFKFSLCIFNSRSSFMLKN